MKEAVIYSRLSDGESILSLLYYAENRFVTLLVVTVWAILSLCVTSADGAWMNLFLKL